MQVGNQIKKYRDQLHLSQEQLAEKIYVTRQTISNWETNKSYPDIHSLVLLSQIFNVSIDQLVKGDLEMMKYQIEKEEVNKFNKNAVIYGALLLIAVLSLVSLWTYLQAAGIFIWILIYGVAIYYAFQLEKQKKKYDIHTYKEILAFTEGKTLDEIQKNQEIGKRHYQTFLLVVGVGVASFFITYMIAYLLHI